MILISDLDSDEIISATIFFTDTEDYEIDNLSNDQLRDKLYDLFEDDEITKYIENVFHIDVSECEYISDVIDIISDILDDSSMHPNESEEEFMEHENF